MTSPDWLSSGRANWICLSRGAPSRHALRGRGWPRSHLSHYRSFDAQKRIFRVVLGLCANAGDKILSIHSVRTAKHVLDFIEECLPEGRGTIILHWITGSASETRRAVKLGCYFSVNVRMASSPNGCRVFHEVPDNRILTETDGPFIERTEKPIELGDVRPALNGIAAIKGIAVDRVQAQVVRNLGDVISLPSGSAGRINLPKTNWVRSSGPKNALRLPPPRNFEVLGGLLVARCLVGREFEASTMAQLIIVSLAIARFHRVSRPHATRARPK